MTLSMIRATKSKLATCGKQHLTAGSGKKHCAYAVFSHTCWSRDSADKGFEGFGARQKLLLKEKFEPKESIVDFEILNMTYYQLHNFTRGHIIGKARKIKRQITNVAREF